MASKAASLPERREKKGRGYGINLGAGGQGTGSQRTETVFIELATIRTRAEGC